MSRNVASLAVLVAVVGLTGCGLTPGDQGEEPSKRATRAVSTDIAKVPPTTLKVWIVSEAEPQVDALNREFERRYPNVTVRTVSKAYEDLVTTAKLALSSDEAPDVITIDAGIRDLGELAKGRLIVPLDPYADAYGWTERFGQALLESNRATDDGRVTGRGRLYGVSQFGEMVGVFYNRAKLRRLGLDVPSTFADFEQSLAKAKQAGEIPIQMGTLDKGMGSHYVNTLLNSFATTEQLRGFVSAAPGARFDTDENLAATRKARDWVAAGYFPRGFEGIDELSAQERFIKGDGVYLFQGTWGNTPIEKGLGADAGFIPLPHVGGSTPLITGSGSMPFAIASRSKQPDVAAAWINFMVGPDNTRVSLEGGQLPAQEPEDGERPDGLLGEVTSVWQRAIREDALVTYLSYATPTMPDTLLASAQELLAGKLTPEEYVARIQADYEDYR